MIGAKQNGILMQYQYDALLGKLGKGSQYSFPQSDRRQGSSGDDVKELQRFLRDFGFFPFDGEPSGYFGPLTRRTILDYQKTNKLQPNGLFDKETREYIKKLITVTQ